MRRTLALGVLERLVAITLAVGLVTGVAGVVLVRSTEQDAMREQAMEESLGLAARTSSRVDDRIQALVTQLRIVSTLPPVMGLGPDAQTRLSTVLRTARDFDELLLYDLGGQPVAAATASGAPGPEDPPDRTQSPPDPGELTVEPLLIDGGLPAVEIAIPVEDPPGTAVGLLVGRAPFALLIPEVSTQLARVGGRTSVTTNDGMLLAHRELERVLAGESLPIVEALPDGSGTVGIHPVDGEPTIVAGIRLHAMPGWVIVEQPERTALAPAQQRIAALTGIFLAVLAAAVLAVVVAGHRLLRNLTPLAVAAERLGGGDLTTRVDGTGPGEIGVLARSFNRMASSLEQRQHELEEAERAARENEERLRLVVEGVEDYAILALGRAADIRTWNTGARRLLGASAEEAIGQPLQRFFYRADPPPDPFDEATRTGRAEAEGWCLRDDGTRFWARLVVTRLHDDTGAPRGFAVILHDLTDRRAARQAIEEALRREQHAADELRRTNQLKDEFLAIAAHEIRTPLSVILGASSILIHDWASMDDAQRHELHGMVDTYAGEMRQIVDRLLDFTQIQAGRVRLTPESVDIAEEIGESLETLRTQLAAHELAVEAPAGEIVVDRTALRHVMNNLLSNAAKFSPEGSTITIRAATTVDHRVVISVTDEGTGIAPDDHERIFELFRQSPNELTTVRGTGVGLAIVQRYVELMGGSVTVDSELGMGSTFIVCIPSVVQPFELTGEDGPDDARPLDPSVGGSSG